MATSITVKLPNGVEYEQPTGLFINNEFVPSAKGETIKVVNPSTEEELAQVHAADASDIDKAVKAARTAFNTVWKNYSVDEISRLLYKLADLFERDLELLSAIEAADSGKPKAQNAAGDVEGAIQLFRYFAGWADKRSGTICENDKNTLAYVVHEPHGVCGQIIPWNYPIGMASWKIGPAIAAGNVIVLKLAENTPLSMLYVGKLIAEAGFPPGVINIVNGYGSVAGSALCTHPDVDKIAFTGSTATGKLIMKMCADTLKNITLECGGKSPLLVFDDCNFEEAVKWAHIGIMSNMGQICSATSRIYVQDTIYDKFVEALKEHTIKTSKVGDVFDDSVFQGPQVSALQQKRVLSYIEKGKSEGARVVLGGNAITGKGYFIEPTIFADVDDSMTVMREEIFGPVVCISKFKTEEEAITRANDTTYGLGSAVFSENNSRCLRVARAIRAGSVWVNCDNTASPRVPFGGFGMSGIGTELGTYGLDIYSVKKAITVNIGVKL
ncbi:uncharacterized protein SAPINGB_P000047 [Magnusiomyces paraingens]|uniref:Aldehyde dehydrogenase domain-containing protein n=1 Tax=Magnusiomyces paraingens TaxID=2606893 RepID=A0A5E8AX92_9ASCO|nr:uncharacterized protein SAPINGB_P000047 [Saprochaete ingens]VVT43576.1 unnamed protein product [Saprochaete ingens]